MQILPPKNLLRPLLLRPRRHTRARPITTTTTFQILPRSRAPTYAHIPQHPKLKIPRRRRQVCGRGYSKRTPGGLGRAGDAAARVSDAGAEAAQHLPGDDGAGGGGAGAGAGEGTGGQWAGAGTGTGTWWKIEWKRVSGGSDAGEGDELVFGDEGEWDAA